MIQNRRHKNIKISLWALGIAMFGSLIWTGCADADTEFEAVDTAMGTVIWQKVYGSEDVTEEIFDEVVRLEQQVLSKRESDSEIGKMNAAAGSMEVTTVSKELYRALCQIREIAKESDGALDVTVGPVVDVWNLDACALGTAEFVLPEEKAIEEALQNTGYEKVVLSEDGICLPEGMSLDLGAVGKGMACNDIADILAAHPKVTGAVISVGGSILTYGEKPDKSPWVVGIKNPRPENGRGNNIGKLILEGTWYVSTSGDYERYVIQDGIRYHHIMDPQTGYPAQSGLVSVTVISKDGLVSDALSTACFVLGQDAGFALAKKYDAQVLAVDMDGNIIMTEGMEAYFLP